MDENNDVVPTATVSNNYTEKTEAELTFTYMNYGYTGYYWSSWNNRNYTGSADNALTMTSFLIEDDQVTIRRWDESGEHATLKSIGADSPGLRPQAETCSDYELKSFAYVSPQVLSLTAANSGSALLGEEPGTNGGTTSPDELDWKEIPGEAGGLVQKTSISNGDQVYIKNASTNRYLKNTQSGNSRLQVVSNSSDATVWTLVANGNQWSIKDSNNRYVTFDGNNSSVGST